MEAPGVDEAADRSCPVQQRPVQQHSATAPAQGPAAGHPISDVMMRLSTYMSQARDHALPDRVLEQAKWHVLDTVAAMVSG